MCRLPKRIQNVDRPSSSAEEDNWDYYNVSRKQKKGNCFHVTLLIYNAPINFVINIRSPVALISQRLFNNTSKADLLNTNHKHVNDNKIEFIVQTKATVKTRITISSTATNYQSKYNTLKGIGSDEAAWIGNQRNN